MDFTNAGESDPGPYPFGPETTIEGGSDAHAIMVDRDTCTLYELFAAHWGANPSAGSGAVFDLGSNALRPAGWTSADAAGLPIFPGLVRYDEVAAGRIRHAIRMTVDCTSRGYIWPARHEASSITDPNVPPMGARVRLKSSFNVSGYPAEVRIVLTALQRYGMFLADNGSNWYISGETSEDWEPDMDGLNQNLGKVKGSDFEIVKTGNPIVPQAD